MIAQANNDLQIIAEQLRKPIGDAAHEIGETMNEKNRFIYEFVFETMNLQSNENILEIGFGNGIFFKDLFEKCNELNVFGIDHSEKMVELAESFNEFEIATGKLKLKLASSSNIPFPHNKFNKIFCNNVIYFWENPSHHLQEIYRVLKPGGNFYCGIRSKDSSMKLPFTKHGFVLYEIEEWESVLAQNGFTNIKVLQKKEPVDLEMFGSVQLESLCFIAQKPNN